MDLPKLVVDHDILYILYTFDSHLNEVFQFVVNIVRFCFGNIITFYHSPYFDYFGFFTVINNLKSKAMLFISWLLKVACMGRVFIIELIIELVFFTFKNWITLD